MKKIISSILMVSFVVLTVSSCSVTEQADTADTVTFVFYNADGKEDSWTDPVAKAITKATGVALEVDYPVMDNEDRVDLMIASGEYPDLIFAKDEGKSLIEAGELIDLTDLIDQYGPNIKKLYGDQYDQLKYSEDDPGIYQLCSFPSGGDITSTSGSAQLQWAVLKENNYEIPNTLYTYETMIKSYMEKYPTINGKDTIGISLCCSDWHWYTTLSNPAGYIADGAVDNGQWIIDDDTYKAYYKPTYDGQKEFYQWLNQMYAEGILDSEFATQTHEEYLEKIADGRVLGLMDANWSYEDAERALMATDQYDRTYAGLPVTMTSDISCAALQKQGIMSGWGIGITKECKDPVKAIQFIDYLCSDEGQILMNWGIKGINYFVDEDGKRYRTDQEIEESNEDTTYKERTGVGLHCYPFPTYGDNVQDSTGNDYTLNGTSELIASYNQEQKAAVKEWKVDSLTEIFPDSEAFKEQTYAPLWSISLPEDLQTLQEKLDEITWKGLIDCVVCDPDQFNATWDEMQEKLKAAGVEKAEALMTSLISENK